MHLAFRHDIAGQVVEIGVCEVDDQKPVVLAKVRTQQNGFLITYRKFELRDKSRSAKKNALAEFAEWMNIALAVKYRKRFILFEDPGTGLSQRRGRENIEFVVDLNDLAQDLTSNFLKHSAIAAPSDELRHRRKVVLEIQDGLF